MTRQSTPMRWPARWKDDAMLRLLDGSGIDCILDGPKPIGAAARNARIIRGEWPGIQSGDHAGAGPTGEPWIDSNGWKIRLEAALHPGVPVWVDASPGIAGTAAGGYALAVADAAAAGGRWIVSLEDDLAAGIGAGNARALDRWKEITAATAFFARHHEWLDFTPLAVIGVVSDFTGGNEFLSHEVLNLLSRANQQYLIVPKQRAGAGAFRGLRAILYADTAPPSDGLRRDLHVFAEAGGLLIAGPHWGPQVGAAAGERDHPRYDIRALGKGRIAVARDEPDDPWTLANDAVVLVSHRYDLLRLWNAGAVASSLAASPNNRAVAQLIFYANYGPRDATVRIARHARSARLWTFDRAEARPLDLYRERDAVEVHLPPVNQYAAIELEG